MYMTWQRALESWSRSLEPRPSSDLVAVISEHSPPSGQVDVLGAAILADVEVSG